MQNIIAHKIFKHLFFEPGILPRPWAKKTVRMTHVNWNWSDLDRGSRIYDLLVVFSAKLVIIPLKSFNLSLFKSLKASGGARA